MKEQPEALRLAEIWEDYLPAYNYKQVALDTAAELRRLHAENEELRAANEAFGKRQEWWNERMVALEAQRDALLEALKALCDEQSGPPLISRNRQWQAAMDKARIAIAAAEGEGK